MTDQSLQAGEGFIPHTVEELEGTWTAPKELFVTDDLLATEPVSTTATPESEELDKHEDGTPILHPREYRETVVALLQLEELERKLKAIDDEIQHGRDMATQEHTNARKLLELGRDEKIDQLIPTPIILAVADVNRDFNNRIIELDVEHNKKIGDLDAEQAKRSADLAARVEAKRKEIKALGLKAGETVKTQHRMAVWEKAKETVDVGEFKGFCKGLPPAQAEAARSMIKVGQPSVAIRNR